MVTSQNYNGWTNYETWAVALWIENNYGSHEYRKELARFCKKPCDYANALKEWIESANPLEQNESSLFSDLLRHAIADVNWQEIAENFLSNEDSDNEDSDDEDSDDYDYDPHLDGFTTEYDGFLW